MGICHDLVSDSKKESYDLGKSFWGINWFDFQDSRYGDGGHPKKAFRPSSYEELITYFNKKVHFEFHEVSDWSSLTQCEVYTTEYIVQLAKEIWAFMESHPDWVVKNDTGYDYSTVRNGETIDEREAKLNLKDSEDWPIYKEIGTRYTIGL